MKLTHIFTFLVGFIILIFNPLSQIFKQHIITSQNTIYSNIANSNTTTTLNVERSILNNIVDNGYNPQTNGLWINWRYGTNPLQTNFNGTGHPDGLNVFPIRHDPLTDIRFLHALWLYRSQNPNDTRYDGEILKFTKIVESEYANAHDMQRGWLYDEEFLDLYNLSKNPFYLKQMENLANTYAKSISKTVGIYFKKSATHPNGYYRPEDAIETGCALIMAGIKFNNPTWITLGTNEVNFVFNHAYISKYHTFPDQMDQVLTPSGDINTNETFYKNKFRNYVIYGNEVRMGPMAQIIISLLDTYKITSNNLYLQRAQDLLNTMTSSSNLLGLWDVTHLGYYEGVIFLGSSPQNPGSITILNGKKEIGRQMLMLWAFHEANSYKNQYSSMEKPMLYIGLNKAYYLSLHGVIYEAKPDWSLVKIHGIPEDWVTAESMGIELEVLFKSSTQYK